MELSQPPIQRVPASLPEVKLPGRGVDHSPTHLAPRLKKESSQTPTSHLGIHGLFQGKLLTADFEACHPRCVYVE